MNNSELLIYQAPDGKIKIDVRLEDETVWLTQAHLCELFQKSKANISEHIKHIFEEGELNEESVVRNFRTTATDEKSYDVRYYNLDVIISVGYRVKSLQGTQFRIWATQRLREYIVKGFALNDERFKSGSSMNYFKELQERIREIRLSEREPVKWDHLVVEKMIKINQGGYTHENQALQYRTDYQHPERSRF